MSHGIEPIGTVLGRRHVRPSPSEREARQAIESYMRDFAREFRDRAPLKSSTTRALHLMQAAGLSLSAFLAYLHEARAITKERIGQGRRIAKPMGFFFAVLEDRLGLRSPPEQQGDPPAPH